MLLHCKERFPKALKAPLDIYLGGFLQVCLREPQKKALDYSCVYVLFSL